MTLEDPQIDALLKITNYLVSNIAATKGGTC